MIFLFKYPTGELPRDNPKDGSFDYDAAENLFFAAQTIQNACGTQALLSVLLNKDGEIDIGQELRDFKEFTGAFPSEVCSIKTSAEVDIHLDMKWVVTRRSFIQLRTNQRCPQLLRSCFSVHRRNTTHS